MCKVVFGVGSFGNSLRIVISDEHMEQASDILLILEGLVNDYNCQFEANIPIQKDEDMDYGVADIWMSVCAGPIVSVMHSHESLKQVLSDELSSAISLMGGGPEGEIHIDFIDVREMSDMYITSDMASSVNRASEQWLEEVLSPLCQNNEEYEALIQSGIDYGKMLEEQGYD